MDKTKEQLELEKKIRENAETIKSLSIGQPEHVEEFDKLQKSDPSLEDLRK